MSKINKLGKSTFVIAILSFLLVAVLAFGGTYAYFSDRADAISGDITTGHLTITSTSGTNTGGVDGATLKAVGVLAQPNQVIFNEETVTAKINTNIAYYTRVRFNVVIADSTHVHYTAEEGVGTDEKQCGDYVANPTDILTITFTDGGKSGAGKKWESSTESDYITDGEDIFYYQLAPTLAKTDAQPSAGAWADNVGTETFTFNVQVNDWVGNNGQEGAEAEGCDYWMDVKITVQVIVEVLQADFLLAVDNATHDDVLNVNTAKPFANGAAADAAWKAALAKAQ
jgi:predicted ribosomally synthesized peptide with SipW-like signal peptide